MACFLRAGIARLLFFAGFFPVLFFSSQSVFAGTHANRLTYVQSLDMEILYVGEKRQWCDDRLDLELITSRPVIFQNSQLVDRQLVQLIAKLRESCPAITQVGVSGYARARPGVAVLEGSFQADNNWRFSTFKLPQRQEKKPRFARTVNNNLLTQNPPGAKPPGGSLRREDYNAHRSYKDYGLLLELARRAIYNQPSLLDNKKVLSRWFREVYPRRFTTPKSLGPASLYRRFYEGTKFDREDVLKEFRSQLESEAVNTPLRITRSFKATIYTRDFNPDRGFPMRVQLDQFSSGVKSSLSSDRLYVKHLGRDVQMYFDNTPDITLLPITDETAARRLSRLLESDRYASLRLEVYVTIGQVGVESFNAGLQREALLTNAIIDGVALVLLPTKSSEIKSLRTIYKWKLNRQLKEQLTVGLTPEEIAKWTGIPMVRGHFAVFQDKGYSAYSNSGWRRYFDLVQLAANPELFEDDMAALYFGDMILSKREKAFISRGKSLFGNSRYADGYNTGRNALDEFEFPEVMASFRKKYKRKIFSKVPKFPIPFVHITPVLLGKYDREKQGFPLSYKNTSGSWRKEAIKFSRLNGVLLESRKNNWRAEAIEIGPQSMPTFLNLTVKQARFLLEALKKQKRGGGSRVLYLAAFSNVSKPAMDWVKSGRRKGRPVLLHQIKPYRLVLYAEKKLRQLVREYDVPDDTAPSEDEAPGANKTASTASLRTENRSRQPSNTPVRKAPQVENLAGRQRLDILGTRLGIAASEAEALLRAGLDAKKTKIYRSIDLVTHLARARKALDAAGISIEYKQKILKNIADSHASERNYLTEGTIFEEKTAGKLKQQIAAYFAPGDTGKRIIAIARAINLKASRTSVAGVDKSLRQKYGIPQIEEKRSGGGLKLIWTGIGPTPGQNRKLTRKTVSRCVPDTSRMYKTSSSGSFTMEDVEIYRMKQAWQAAKREQAARQSFLGENTGNSGKSESALEFDVFSTQRWRDKSGKTISDNIPRLYGNWESRGCGVILTVSISSDWLYMVLLDTDAVLSLRNRSLDTAKPVEKPVEANQPEQQKIKF